MGRIIGKGIKNKLEIRDQISNTTLVVYYRVPSSEERVNYFSSQFEFKEGKMETIPSKARLEGGYNIILGFEEGGFIHEVDGELKPYSSDAGSPNFEAGWKDLLKEYAPDILEVLALHAFEGIRTVASQMAEVDRQKN